MNVFESIADRRIREARAAGLFDDLPLAGKPIPDLGRERPPGWWAARVVRQERSKLRREDLDQAIRRAMPALWRLETEEEVAVTVATINEQIAAYNATTTWEPRAPFDVAQVIEQWRGYWEASAARSSPSAMARRTSGSGSDRRDRVTPTMSAVQR